MQGQSYARVPCGVLGKYRHPRSSCRHGVAQPIIPRMLGCWNVNYEELSGFQQIVTTRKNRAKLRLRYLQK